MIAHQELGLYCISAVIANVYHIVLYKEGHNKVKAPSLLDTQVN